MKIVITTPAAKGSTLGNRITAERYGKLFRELGHRAQIVSGRGNSFSDDSIAKHDLLVALHAKHSAAVVKRFAFVVPGKPIVVVMTGTDLHRDMPKSRRTRDTLDRADCIVLLEPEGRKLLTNCRAQKSRVIFQSALPVANPPSPLKRCFEVSLIGHLRPVKDPFLVAKATKFLPAESKIKIFHFGEALSKKMKKRALLETERNPRYQWLGGRKFSSTQRRLSRSRLTLVTSLQEGAPSVISEAVVNGVPILATRIMSSLGLLGHDYPGLFEIGAARELAKKMLMAETDGIFYDQLCKHGAARKRQFAPARELASWRRLIKKLS